MNRIDRDKFAAAHHKGMSREQLAQHFGISPTTVTRIRRELSLPLEAPKPPRRRPKKVSREEVARLTAQGLAAVKIAEQLGVHPDSITRVRHELGISHTECIGRPMTLERIKTIEGMLEDGWSFAEIHRTEGADMATLRKYFPGKQWTRQQTTEHVRALRLVQQHFNKRPATYNPAKYRNAA